MRYLLTATLLLGMSVPSLALADDLFVNYVLDLPIDESTPTANDPNASVVIEQVTLSGGLSIPISAFGAPIGDGRRPIDSLADIIYDIRLDAVARARGAAEAVDLEFRFDNTNSTLVSPFAPLYVNGDAIDVGGIGLPIFTPLLDLTADRAAVPLGFPDGRRFGDDGGDAFIIQLFQGSVNLGILAITEPGAFPSVLYSAQLSTDDSLTIAREVAVVPLPTGVLLFTSGLAAFLRVRRRL